MTSLEREHGESARDYALRALKHAIVHLDLVPGSRVSENELAAELGLSRTPVREALQELAKVRVVEVYPQRGSTIALIDYALVEETRFMRAVLETSVVELCCKAATADGLRELWDNVRLQEYYLESGAADKLWQLDNAFHHMLFAIADREQTYAMLSSFTIHFDRVRSMSLVAVRDNKTVADHRAIVEAIERRDAPEARRAMNRHLERFRVDEVALRERFVGYFKER